MATADKLTTVAENVPKVYHAGQMNVIENAECLKGSKTSTAMLLDDVSPVTHDMEVRVRSKNLLPYPFTYATLESNGVTFTDNKDGTITLNGQNNGSSLSTYNLLNTSDKLSFLKPNTDYYLSCNLDNIIRSLRTVNSSGVYKYYTYGNINFPPDETPDRLFIQIKATDTTTYDNTVVKLQIELGTTATDYEPYNSDIQNVHSKNLIPYPYAETTKTENGITFTDNGNGTITVNGTTPSDSGVSFQLTSNDISIKAGTYSTSGCVLGSNSSGDNILLMILAQDDDYNIYDLSDTGSNKTATIVNDSHIINLSIQIPPDITLNNAVFKPQLEYGSTATAYAQYHEPYPLVVSRCGKNLFDESVFEPYIYSQDDEAYTFENKVIHGKDLTPNIIFKENTQYTLTYTAKQSEQDTLGYPRLQIHYTDGTYTTIQTTTSYTTIVLKSSTNKTIEKISSTYNTNGYFYIKKGSIQLEEGTASTDYEPYITPTDYTPNADGTVDDVERLYPSTTLLTNDPYGKVYIDCDYYKDIDKTFNELTTSVALSGGE